MDLSVILPALNEANNLPGLLEELQRTLPKFTPNFEILVVDGGSSDDTIDVAKRFGVDCWTQTRPGLTRALLEAFSQCIYGDQPQQPHQDERQRKEEFRIANPEQP